MYGRYPFLIGARRLLDRNSSEIKYKQATLDSFSNLLNGWDLALDLDQVEVNIFYNQLIIVKKLANSFITKRYINNFAKRFEYFITQDINDMEIREQVLNSLEIVFKIQFIGKDIVAMKVTDYLMMVREDGSLFKLIDTGLKKGRITISTPHFILLLRTKLEKMLTKKIKNMSNVDHIEFGNGYDPQIESLKNKYHVVYGEIPVHSMTNEKPPCMVQILEKGKNTHHLLHIERVTLGIYMKSKNYDEEEMLDVFRGLEDWNEKVTRYQLGRLGNYKVYNCDKMETQGLCCKDKDTKGRCGRIMNPYNY